MSKKAKPRVYDKAGKQVKVADKSWYTLQASGEADQRNIEIFVYGEIGAWGVTANQFVQDLRAMDDGVSPVIVAFNSIGGDLFDGLAIHNTLSRLGERCTGRVDALAASAASVAVCGAHRVVIAANAMLMIHNPYTYAGGDAEDFRRVADVLDQTLEAIIAAYKAKAPDIDEAELRRMVNAETWLTANEAVALGLADEVGDGLKVSACLGQGSVLQRFQHAPPELLAQLDEEPEAEPPEPDPAPVLDAAKLALMVTQGCAAAGISNLVDPILAATKLESEAVVQAALTKAKSLHGLCVAARLPELTGEFISAGLDEAAVRARLFDKLVSSGGTFEINNSLPLDDDPAATIKAKQVDTHSIWATRQAAQNGNSKGARA
ncbi:Clp protease ClpP [Pseudomonas sp. CBSPBW29]|uniref:head maturation protease, ClpP-related n=1 Tax=Pseudomonas sp. CBS TaxID=2971912 RepID=UPI0021AB9CEB|nr:head maturation protease, ClpP-related [Pseudomonas sp. CBS]WEL43160.1 Clp protease ClpP [Pseudomonas sp. CBSPBW29]WEL64227.1 Clp protease ClpP [Pseudomonas sp. CBSPGW29]WEL73407.1 Clp protease ClpP [Pseudomonas sp. CBSPCGW29]WEL74727.1 Clp protease ClpP [Pseudomonas sp. CBSPAW29]WEL81032.1 Clp protease ClpP [Pseudomonas sp. CBSPCAW29]WEL89539.1 Clp protease ClpP [Pseudomonas sp. CBSPCBW29]